MRRVYWGCFVCWPSITATFAPGGSDVSSVNLRFSWHDRDEIATLCHCRCWAESCKCKGELQQSDEQ